LIDRTLTGLAYGRAVGAVPAMVRLQASITTIQSVEQNGAI